jgi:ribosomal protein S18 acetylase RimI-like enzyme
MAASPSNPPIEYGVYTAADADAMAKLLGEVFSRRDPPAYAVGLTAPEFEAFVRLLLPNAAVQGLTLVAKRAETGEMIGALLTEDCASDMPEGMEGLSAKFDPIFDILVPLGEEYWGERQPRPGEALHLFLLGVAERAAGNGVAQELVANCLALGVSRGYRLAVTEATNETSQHIFRKHGFVERVRRSYASHRFGGQAVFASIAEHGGPMLMDRSLVPSSGTP